MAAGRESSPARIAMCEFAPPQVVTNPEMEREKSQSNPGSALGIQTIFPLSSFFLLMSETSNHFFLSDKIGRRFRPLKPP